MKPSKKKSRAARMLAAGLTAGLVAAGAAHADTPASALTPGLYGQMLIGGAKGHSANYDSGTSLSVGWGLGYRFTPELGAELFLRGLDFDISPFASNRTEPYPERHAGVALTGSLPVNSLFNLTGRLGVGRTTLKRDNGEDRSRTNASLGAGAALQLGSHMALTAGYERYTGINVNVWNVGWELRY